MKTRALFALLLLTLFSSTILAKSPPNFSESLIVLHNQARAKPNHCGTRKIQKAPPLKANRKLHRVAKKQVLKMLKTKKLNHHIDGLILERVERSGYLASAMSENLAFGTDTAESTFKLWMRSKDHCINLLNRDYLEIGVFHKNGYTVAIYASPQS